MMIALPFLLFAAASGASAPIENGQVAPIADAKAAVPNALNPPARTTAQVQAQVSILRASIIRQTSDDNDLRETDRSYQRRNAQIILEFY
jgi:hypothetical protein